MIRMEMGTSGNSDLIAYRCHRRDHQPNDAGRSRVFVHRGSWAYCEAGKLAPDHEFLETGGLSRRQLEGHATGGRWAGTNAGPDRPGTEGSRS
jgi:hypothetical protein